MVLVTRRRVSLLLGLLAACGGSSDGDDAATPAGACRNDAGCDDGGARDPDGASSTVVTADCNGVTQQQGTIASQPVAEGVDLIVVQYAACRCCYGCDVAVRIANAGTVTLESAVRVEVLASRQAFEELRASGQDEAATSYRFEERLAPGQVSEPLIRHVGLGRSEQRDGYFIVVDPLDEIPESDESNNELDADGSDILICF